MLPPSTGLTAKQEAFVHAYAATGCAAEAYRRAYTTTRMTPRSVRREALRLVRQPKISARVAELRAAARERTLVTVASLSAQLEEVYRQALAAKAYGVAVRAVLGQARLHGLIPAAGRRAGPRAPSRGFQGPRAPEALVVELVRHVRQAEGG